MKLLRSFKKLLMNSLMMNPGEESKKILYRTFYMNEFEFALAEKYFRKTVKAPDKLESILNIGEQKIPLIDIHRMMNLTPQNIQPYNHIILLEADSMYFGIYCHREGNAIFAKESISTPVINVQTMLSLVQKIEIQKTLITFSMDNTYAIDVEDISEIIPFPEEINTSPELPPLIRGYFIFKGERVYIVDTGILCHSKNQRANTSKELLIIKKDRAPYALMIDSFDFFVSFPKDKWIKLNTDLQTVQSTQQVFIQMHNGDSKLIHMIILESIISRMVTK